MARKRRKHPTTAESKRTKKRLNLSADEEQDLAVGCNQELFPQVDQCQTKLIKNHSQPEQTKEGTFEFLSLPGELRNMIYGYVFADTWYVYSVKWLRLKATKYSKHPLALLQTCKQVHNEAADLPFTLSPFKFGFDYVWDSNEYPKGFHLARTVIAHHWIHGKVRLNDYLPLKSPKLLESGAYLTAITKMNCFFTHFASLRNLVLTCSHCKKADYNGVWDWEADHGMLILLMHSTFPQNCSITIVWTKKTFKIENLREFLDAGLPVSRT